MGELTVEKDESVAGYDFRPRRIFVIRLCKSQNYLYTQTTTLVSQLIAIKTYATYSWPWLARHDKDYGW